MTQSNYHRMISQGRKAGLSTREIYPAMLTRPVEGSEQPGQADGNGVISTVNAEGHRVYRTPTPPAAGNGV